MKIFKFDDEEPVEILKNGGLIAFPTETVYGIGVRFDNENSFCRLIKVKNRPGNKPFTMMIGDKNLIKKYAFISEKQEKIINKFLPGRITIILKKRETIPSYVSLGGDTIGFRVPDSEVLRGFLNRIGVPLLVPSANKSGLSPAKNIFELEKQFNDELDGVILGDIGDGVPSTVVSLIDDKIKVLRKGEISEGELNEVLNGR